MNRLEMCTLDTTEINRFSLYCAESTKQTEEYKQYQQQQEQLDKKEESLAQNIFIIYAVLMSVFIVFLLYFSIFTFPIGLFVLAKVLLNVYNTADFIENAVSIKRKKFKGKIFENNN